MLSSFAFFAGKARACEIHPGGYSSTYLVNSGRNSSLLVDYTNGYSLTPALNNTCGFFISSKQSGAYKPVACICHVGFPYDGDDIYNIVLSGQNVSNEIVACMKKFLEGHYCDPPPMSTQIAIVAAVSGVAALVSIGCIFLYCKGKKLKTEDSVALLNTASTEARVSPN